MLSTPARPRESLNAPNLINQSDPKSDRLDSDCAPSLLPLGESVGEREAERERETERERGGERERDGYIYIYIEREREREREDMKAL